jgi:hypothetical protein
MQAVYADKQRLLEHALLRQEVRCCDACCKAKHTSQFDQNVHGFDAICETCKPVVSRLSSLGMSATHIRAAIRAGIIYNVMQATNEQTLKKKALVRLLRLERLWMLCLMLSPKCSLCVSHVWFFFLNLVLSNPTPFFR